MKRSSVRNLNKAKRLFRRRKFTQVITLLEPQVFLYRDSYQYYYLLGMSCLHTGDFAGAFSYLQRALDIDERPEAMLGLGAVLLRRRQMDQALRNYLDLLDLDNGNRRAQRALQWLRNLESPDEVIEWFEDRRIRKILPSSGMYIPSQIIFGGTIVLLVVLVAAGIRFALPRLSALRGDQRPGMELVQLTQDTGSLVEPGSDGTVRLTPREIERLFAEVGRYFNDHRDNMVRRELNRIGLSNAVPSIKVRAELLRDYLRTPDFSDFRDGFTYAEVSRDLPLYSGVYVRWKGRVANLVIGEDRIRFDLLVGYHTGQVLEGIVPVELDFAVVLANNNPIELIGAIQVEENNRFRLRGTSIRILSQRELN